MCGGGCFGTAAFSTLDALPARLGIDLTRQLVHPAEGSAGTSDGGILPKDTLPTLLSGFSGNGIEGRTLARGTSLKVDDLARGNRNRSEERRVGKECRL